MSCLTERTDVTMPPTVPNKPRSKPLGIMSTILGECLCEPFPTGEKGLMSAPAQFIELHGIQFIGLGAVVDELTPKERVYDTLEQLTTRTERLISIGYLVDDEKSGSKITETIPLDIWSKTYPNDKSMSRAVKKTISSIKVRTSRVHTSGANCHFEFIYVFSHTPAFFAFYSIPIEQAI
jgi:hypothetical protein